MPPREQHRLRVAALLIAVSLAGCGAPKGDSASGVPSGKGLNVLLISIDTLRADHLGCYGYQRPTSPNIDAFAKESVRFDQAISQAPWTTPSHMTLMTSLYPSSHGVNRSFADLVTAPLGQGKFRTLSPSQPTLAEILRSNNYETLALTGGATMAPELGFGHGFDEFVVKTHKTSDAVWDQLRSWLDRDRAKPFLIFFHTFEVHAPYLNTRFAENLMTEEQRAGMSAAIAVASVSEQDSQQEYLRSQGLLNRQVTEALYDGGIRDADAFVGKLLDELRRRNLYDRTLIVVLSDHGEAFAEHDPARFYDAHCDTQYEELIHVPLVVRFPPLAGKSRVVGRPVGLVDVAPTILDLLDIRPPERWQGHSLESLLVRDWDDLPWTVSSATCSGPSIKAWREDRFKYIATFAVGKDGERSFIPGPVTREELYDLLEDPGEKRNLASAERELTALKRALLFRHYDSLKHWQSGNPSLLSTPTTKLEKDLKALGYL